MTTLMGLNRKGEEIEILSAPGTAQQALLTKACRQRLNISGVKLTSLIRDIRLKNYQFTSAVFKELRGCYFNNVAFENCDFSNSFLRACSFTNCTFRCCDFVSASMCNCEFIHCRLEHCDFSSANATHSTFAESKLRHCSFLGIDLRELSFYKSSLYRCELPYHQLCPEVGSFIAFKYLRYAIAVLRIPAKAARLTALRSHKCRASQAEVIAIFNQSGDPIHFSSSYHFGTPYKIGKVLPDKWDPNPATECSYGIHFFLGLEETIDNTPFFFEGKEKLYTWLKEHKDGLTGA